MRTIGDNILHYWENGVKGNQILFELPGIGVNPLHPNIRMHILHTVFYTFLKVLMRRICWTVRSSLVVDHFLDSHDLNVWFRVILWGEIRCQSLLGVKGLAKFKLAGFYRTSFFMNASNNETKFFLHIVPFQSCVKISLRIISVLIFENEVTTRSMRKYVYFLKLIFLFPSQESKDSYESTRGIGHWSVQSIVQWKQSVAQQ